MEPNIDWKEKYKSELLMVCHMDAKAMHEVGAISDKEMQEFDRDCLISSPKRSFNTTKNPSQKPTPAYTKAAQR